MKKILTLLLSCSMLFGAAGCADTTPKEAPAQAVTEMPEDMASMERPVHALAETMLETGLPYSPDDPVFFWKSLSAFADLYSDALTGSERVRENAVISVPGKTVQSLAISMFSSYKKLPEIPQELADVITYDTASDSYKFPVYETVPEIPSLHFLSEKEGTYTLEAVLKDPAGEEKGTWKVTLSKNTYDSAVDASYQYSVAFMEGEDSAPAKKTEAAFNGLSDAHSAEVTMPDGTVKVFQFDPSSAAAKILSELKEGQRFTFFYKEQGEGGAHFITQITD